MAFSEDAKRLLRDNLKNTYTKVAAIAVALLAWTLPYKAAEYAGVESRGHRWLAVLAFYTVIGIATLILFLYRSLSQAYENLGPGIPTQKALADLAAKFIGFEKKSMVDECLMFANGSSISVNDICLLAHTSVTKIEQSSSTPTVPAEVQGTLEVIAESRQDGGVLITSETVKSTPTLCLWSINFLPELRKGSSIQFRYRIKTAEQSFATTHEDMKARGLDREHYSHLISFPTAHLRLKITFDQSICPTDVACDVWSGKGGLRHMDEYIRVNQNDCFQRGLDQDRKLYCILDVPYPVFGLRYLITWLPQKQRVTV